VENQTNSENSQFAVPQIALPKGGGAIRGIGEKFSTNAVTGTGSLLVPLAVSPSRSGFSPQLSLMYDSGSGNGVFGVGWNLALPTITRKTDKGIPRYHDREQSDVFLISDAEDLVPVLHQTQNAEWAYDEYERDGYEVKLYRPRIEGLFARIERWTRLADGDTHWRSFSKENVLTVYGSTPESRISDPRQPGHVFKWLISSSHDCRGNAIRYEYVAENDLGVDLRLPSEHRRSRSANRYLKRIKYGNRKPLERTPKALESTDWMFEVVFDFGDECYREFETNGERKAVVVTTDEHERPVWPTRKDPFSTYRSGFEVRTHRLCRRALLFHHFPEELDTPRYLVRSTDFEYREKLSGSFMARVIQSGYTYETHDHYLKRSLPPLDFSYTPSPLEEESPDSFQLSEADARNLPQGIDGEKYRWLDLDGEGISGVLTQQGSGWYYKHNLGNGRFGTSKLINRKPSTGKLDSVQQQLLDVAGDGSLDLVELSSGGAGFYERTLNGETEQEGWGPFRAFRAYPTLDWGDPNLRFVDLTGDGIADVLVTEDVAIRWHPSLLRRGFGAGARIPAPHDENQGPRVVFADRTQSIYLADMSGDGLTDIVRIRNGEVCYWPNRGYGHFGSKVTMSSAPWFDAPNLFDQRRIRLADTDGSGVTDILYLSDDGIHVYLNQSGNGWSSRKILRGVASGDLRSVSVTDFLGHGTACLVWSSPLPSDTRRPLRYVDLMRGQKPHLLTKITNNLGAETVVEYGTSTEFYLADRAAGRPWVTRLPFPVHVVKRVETYDYVSHNRFVSTSSYHHGYYDSVEREFRGFGCVEQTDTEELAVLQARNAFPVSTNEDKAWNVPPVLTKTWYHTGVFLGMDRISRHLAHEYYREPHESCAMQLEDAVLPPGLTSEEAREACRSLKGSILRQETYALDGSAESARPYTVSESNSTIHVLQPRDQNRHAVFFTHAREVLTFNYERKLYEVASVQRADPRVSHALTLDVDDYGNILRSVSIGYGRRFPDESNLLTDSDREKQGRILATLTENRFTNAVKEEDDYCAAVPAGTRTYEIIHLSPQSHEFGATNLFRFDEIRKRVHQASDGQHDLAFEDLNGLAALEPGPYRRLFQESRMLYRSDKLDGLLSFGNVEPLALPGESYRLALTSGLIKKIYRREEHGHGENLLPHAKAVVGHDCGYVDLDDNDHWWVPSGCVFYSPHSSDDPDAELAYARQHFFIPRRFRDPFGNTTTVTYDAHDLAPIETRDPVGNVIHASLNYRVLRPDHVTDANGNRTEAAYDALAMVAGTAVMGKADQNLGDSLEDFHADLPESVLLDHIRHPLHDPGRVLGNATTRLIYDVFAFDRTRHELQPHPAVSYVLARETHVSDLAPGERTKIQHSFSYSDGLGREIQKKIQAEPGPVVDGGTTIDHRWVGTGWTIFNNKGKPVRQYEPFFSATHHFDFAVIKGVSPTIVYDPIKRVIATLHPNHSFEKVVFDPWRQESWDVNDTVLEDPRLDPDVGEFLRRISSSDYLPTWYAQRVTGGLGQAERDAAHKTARHARTPSLAYADSLGRAFLSIMHNRFERGATVDEFYPTRSELDIQGNQLSVIDALGRVIMRYHYDLTGARIHQDSADAGQRWTLNDVLGKPVLAWDNRDHRLRREYDALRRPTRLFLQTGKASEKLVERAEYGESEPHPEARNLRAKLFRQFDEAGIVTIPEYDFKGNIPRTTRQLLLDYRDEIDWTSSPPLETEIFQSETSYDALNRPETLTAPDRSRIRLSYNEANLLEQLHVHLKGTAGFAPYVSNIDYNAKGQRELIEYLNGAHTTSTYDPLTFRLIHLSTTRVSDGAHLQDLSYAYDPVGNITSICDAAQQTVYFKNQVVLASGDYVYDAIYRLLRANGREHAGWPDHPETTYNDIPRIHLPLPGDAHAMRNYRENYHYDGVGNILEVIHSATNGDWTRKYHYHHSAVNNRLSSASVGQLEDHYSYDQQGNMTRTQSLPLMKWNFRNQLASTQTQVVNDGPAETTYYVYDSSGQRVRKATDAASGKRKAERIYLAGFEIYREYANESVSLERTTLHIMDDKHRVALVETREGETSIRYQFDNHLGSACVELDENADIISYEEYYPYGSTSFQAGRSIAEVSLKRYRFTAKERDNETGFNYHGTRYYAPWIGKWISCDPAGFVDGTCVYAYSRNNPIRMSDPNGTQTTTSSAEEEAQACLIDPSTPVPTVKEKQQQASIPSEHPLASTAAPRKQEYTGPTIGPVSEEQLRAWKNQRIENLDLPPDDSVFDEDESGMFAAFYTIAYGVKQSIYKPIKSWVLDEHPQYIDSQGRVQTWTGPVDHTDALGAIVQIGLLFTPVGPEAEGMETLAVGGKAEMELSMNSSNALKGIEPASEELLKAVGSRRTIQIVQPGSEEMRYLEHIGAEANVGGETMTHILLRPNPSKAAVLEEFLHGTQSELGIIDRLGSSGMGSAETHVKDFMIRHSQMLGLSPEDVAILKTLRDMGL
jgi:RHS repeat-associated protein